MITRLRPGATSRKLIGLIALLCVPLSGFAEDKANPPLLIHAARVFDGVRFRTATSVLVADGQITRIDARESFTDLEAEILDLGDTTLLPGFIELHAHLLYHGIPAATVLAHGVTTVRDVGGPLQKPQGGDGALRLLTAGPILTAPGGYPIPLMGEENLAVAVASEAEARAAVRRLIEGGAAVVKVALEPGGEHGAPWSAGHSHVPVRASLLAPAPMGAEPASPLLQTEEPVHLHNHWPLLPEKVVKAIVDEAHRHGHKVTAHLAEAEGVKRALQAGVDEWAHMPCAPIPHRLLQQAVAQGVVIVGTLDTLSRCAGIAENTRAWATLGGELLYGAEIAHPDIPWGIDAQELNFMLGLAGMEVADVLRAATSGAGKQLNVPLLGTLQTGAPADLIAVRGDVAASLKSLEYPDLVISGGKIMLDRFENAGESGGAITRHPAPTRHITHSLGHMPQGGGA